MIAEQTGKLSSIEEWSPIFQKTLVEGRLPSVDESGASSRRSMKNGSSRLSEYSLGRISFGACCFDSNELVNSTMR